MMRQHDTPKTPDGDEVLSGDETLGQVREILGEINELDEAISRQVDNLMSVSHSEPPEALMAFLSNLEKGTRVHDTVHHLLKIKEDWDVLYTRICAFNEDDEELLEGLVLCVGDLLIEQPDGIGERWINNLEEFFEKQRSNVN